MSSQGESLLGTCSLSHPPGSLLLAWLPGVGGWEGGGEEWEEELPRTPSLMEVLHWEADVSLMG